jgi:hypothetical protein
MVPIAPRQLLVPFFEKVHVLLPLTFRALLTSRLRGRKEDPDLERFVRTTDEFASFLSDVLLTSRRFYFVTYGFAVELAAST